jgi:hypothetical protein
LFNVGSIMNSKLSYVFLGNILLFNVTGSAASLLLGPNLDKYSAVAGAAQNISANSLVTNDLGALAAIDIGAGSDTANLYSDTGAVGTGDGGNTENIYAVAAVTLGAGLSSLDVYSAVATIDSGANSKTASESTLSTLNLYKQTFDIDQAAAQLASAHEALSRLKPDFILGVGMGYYIFEARVHSGSALTVAANSTIQFDGMNEKNPIWVINLDATLFTGADASVIWNLGGALSLGAGTQFVGTAFVKATVAGIQK